MIMVGSYNLHIQIGEKPVAGKLEVDPLYFFPGQFFDCAIFFDNNDLYFVLVRQYGALDGITFVEIHNVYVLPCPCLGGDDEARKE